MSKRKANLALTSTQVEVIVKTGLAGAARILCVDKNKNYSPLGENACGISSLA